MHIYIPDQENHVAKLFNSMDCRQKVHKIIQVIFQHNYICTFIYQIKKTMLLNYSIQWFIADKSP